MGLEEEILEYLRKHQYAYDMDIVRHLWDRYHMLDILQAMLRLERAGLIRGIDEEELKELEKEESLVDVRVQEASET